MTCTNRNDIAINTLLIFITYSVLFIEIKL
jgi:hypothetical protein